MIAQRCRGLLRGLSYAKLLKAVPKIVRQSCAIDVTCKPRLRTIFVLCAFYEDGVTELRKPVKNLNGVKSHVVFFHGLNGSFDTTFSSSSVPPELWPEWLDSDLGASVAVWGIDYGASASRWQPGESMALPDRAENILPLLANEPGLQSGDIILVGYSLGGLVVKQVLRLAQDQRSTNARIASFVRRVRKVVFIATPHFGSDHATWGNRLSILVRPREAVAGLSRNDAQLRALNRWYRTFCQENQIQNLILFETNPISQRVRVPVIGSEVSFRLGTAVKPDSSDPGVPNAVAIIPIDADHRSIVSPKNRDAQTYVHIRDFVVGADAGVHRDTAIESRLTTIDESLKAQTGAVEALHGDVKTGLSEVVAAIDRTSLGSSPQQSAASENALVTSETLQRLAWLRKSRYLVGFDAKAESIRLADDLRTGDLAAASREAKRMSFAWCARIVSSIEASLSQAFLDEASRYGGGEENTIAEAFLQLSRDNDKPGALAKVAAIDSPTARSASVIIAGHGLEPAEVLLWMDNAGISFDRFDGDGKFVVLERRMDCGQWPQAIAEADTLDDEDFEGCPVLLTTSAALNLSAAIHDDLKPAAIRHLPLDMKRFILGTDAPAMERRRKARSLYERAESVLRGMGWDRIADIAADYALWLGLRDDATAATSLKALEASMADPKQSLRRLPMALQFGLKLDLAATEREIDRQTTLSGGKSPEAAIARFALAEGKASPKEMAAYIDQHRSQLIEYYDPQWIGAIETELLARSGQIPEAREKLEELKRQGLPADGISSLNRIIDEAEGADPVSSREAQYAASGNLADLIVLVDLLRQRQAWPKLVTFGKILFEETRDGPSLETYVHALYSTGGYREIIGLWDRFPELFAAGRVKQTLAWAYFHEGDLRGANTTLEAVESSRDNSIDRRLAINIAVTSGNWNALGGFVEQEWANRDQRDAAELLQMGQLAQHIGAERAKDLIKEAAARADGNAAILVACYGVATSAGWEDDPTTHQWLDQAIVLSGDDGPVQRVNIKQLLEQAPSWNEHVNRAWDELTAGRVPVFTAARALNRSLLDMYLLPAVSNLHQPDPRKRGIVFAFSGARASAPVSADVVALDATAILTLGFLGLLRQVLGNFRQVLIPHTTMRWLFEERQRLQFHQPSRVRDALEVKRLLDGGQLKRFEPTGSAKPEVEREVGPDLALLLTAAAEGAEGGNTLGVVVRPAPLHRAGTLMDELADVHDYERLIVGCGDVIAALKKQGHLTVAEEARCKTYLGLHELPWPNAPTIQPGATLYLDDLAVSYLQHLRLLDRLQAAGFSAFVSSSEFSEGDALVRYESFGGEARTVIEEIRASLAEGIATGRVKPGKLSKDADEPTMIKNHPTGTLFDLAGSVEAFIIDDRSLNRHQNLRTADDNKPIHTSLDLLATLRTVGNTDAQVGEHLTRLRRAGFALIPVVARELNDWLQAAPVSDGKVLETAELKAIRENLLRVRMTDLLQLPMEHVWLDELNLACVQSIRAQWVPDIDDAIARARSEWVLGIFDIRGWVHRMQIGADDPEARFRSQALMLTMLPDADDAVRGRYWQWLEEAILEPLRNENTVSYGMLIDAVEQLIGETVRRGAERQVDDE